MTITRIRRKKNEFPVFIGKSRTTVGRNRYCIPIATERRRIRCFHESRGNVREIAYGCPLYRVDEKPAGSSFCLFYPEIHLYDPTWSEHSIRPIMDLCSCRRGEPLRARPLFVPLVLLFFLLLPFSFAFFLPSVR